MSRFYIPRRRSPALDIAGLALRYADIKQRGDIAKKGQKLTERELELRERESKAEYGYGDDTGGATGLAHRREGRMQAQAGRQERLTGLAEREEERKEQDYTVQWERRMNEPPQPANLIGLKDAMPAFAPAINTILEGIQNGKINNRWDAFHLLKQSETIHLKTTRDTVEKQISKATKDGKHTEAAQLGQLYNALKPGFLEDFFGFPKALREERPEFEAGKEGAETWGPEEKGPAGTTRQVSSRGKIKEVYEPFSPSKEGPTTAKRERRLITKRVRDAERIILTKPFGKADQPLIDDFNRFAEKPYVYIYEERLFGDRPKKINLPKYKGKQVYARDVWEKAHDPNNPVDIKTVLEMLGAL